MAESREATGRRADHNGVVELERESQRVIDCARCVFGGRDGRLALTLLLASPGGLVRGGGRLPPFRRGATIRHRAQGGRRAVVQARQVRPCGAGR